MKGGAITDLSEQQVVNCDRGKSGAAYSYHTPTDIWHSLNNVCRIFVPVAESWWRCY